ncbi:uncharacterized protein LOC124117507 [Haliotis rufescens]|uniref:uncharacterized protein LOC124117507 n=1 Tax=Haliotis rufescens TaxID=6454 RepID=UPI00201EA4C5|nr:uncharacterized protein LOC124117507 [Haliotis rufescens]
MKTQADAAHDALRDISAQSAWMFAAEGAGTTHVSWSSTGVLRHVLMAAYQDSKAQTARGRVTVPRKTVPDAQVDVMGSFARWVELVSLVAATHTMEQDVNSKRQSQRIGRHVPADVSPATGSQEHVRSVSLHILDWTVDPHVSTVSVDVRVAANRDADKDSMETIALKHAVTTAELIPPCLLMNNVLRETHVSLSATARLASVFTVVLMAGMAQSVQGDATLTANIKGVTPQVCVLKDVHLDVFSLIVNHARSSASTSLVPQAMDLVAMVAAMNYLEINVTYPVVYVWIVVTRTRVYVHLNTISLDTRVATTAQTTPH